MRKRLLGRYITLAVAFGLGISVLSGCGQANNGTNVIENQAEDGDEVTSAKAEEGNEDIVSFSVKSGVYEKDFMLELSYGESGKIYYTTDGSSPIDSESRILYEDGIQITDCSDRPNVVSAVSPELIETAHCYYDKSTKKLVSYVEAPSDDAVDKCNIIKAVCEKEDGSFSEVKSETYFIGDIEEHVQGIRESAEAAGLNLAVISITMDYDDLFSSGNGIYVRGKLFDISYGAYISNNGEGRDDCGRKLAANYNERGRNWEREASIEIFESDGTTTNCVISQNCGVRIQGNYSRSDWQKGFRIYARDDYGNKRFKYPLFGNDLVDDEGKVIDSFKSFVLRNGGNCAFTSKFNDAFWQSLVGSLDCETQKTRPAVVYLNGEYWGLYVMEEDYSSEYFEDTHGVESDDVIAYKGDAETYACGYKLDLGELPEGETDSGYYLRELYEFFNSHSDLANDADYEEFAKLVDVESCRDYFAVECWINNKWDWPGKNWSMWKTIPSENADPGNEYNDGKWRFCFYDVEFGGVSGKSDAATNTIKEDNYKPLGLLDMGTSNPAVLSFAYLMTNEGFRQDFYAALNGLTEKNFEHDSAISALEKFEKTYGPLYDQFFERYPGSGDKDNALNGGYASSKCIRDFLDKRQDNIQKMIDYAESVYN